MDKKRNVTLKEMVEMTFNPPDIDINEVFSPETRASTERYNEWEAEEKKLEASKKKNSK